MTYKLIPTDSFKRDLKKLSKKYPSLLEDLQSIENDLLQNPRLGSEIYKNCYKIRIAIKSKGKGKSGGGRVITHFAISDDKVYLLSIYDKSIQDSVSDSYIKHLLDNL